MTANAVTNTALIDQNMASRDPILLVCSPPVNVSAPAEEPSVMEKYSKAFAMDQFDINCKF